MSGWEIALRTLGLIAAGIVTFIGGIMVGGGIC
jgi:hypothetical protein